MSQKQNPISTWLRHGVRPRLQDKPPSSSERAKAHVGIGYGVFLSMLCVVLSCNAPGKVPKTQAPADREVAVGSPAEKAEPVARSEKTKRGNVTRDASSPDRRTAEATGDSLPEGYDSQTDAPVPEGYFRLCGTRKNGGLACRNVSVYVEDISLTSELTWTDLTPLRKAKGLKSLGYVISKPTDLAPLAVLDALEELHIAGYTVTRFSLYVADVICVSSTAAKR